MTKKQKEKQKDTHKKKQKQNKSYLTTVNKLLAILIILGSFYFVISLNDLSIKGFELYKLKNKVTELADENMRMELLTMDLESYKNIETAAQDLKMVKVDKIEYVTVENSGVAKK